MVYIYGFQFPLCYAVDRPLSFCVGRRRYIKENKYDLNIEYKKKTFIWFQFLPTQQNKMSK